MITVCVTSHQAVELPSIAAVPAPRRTTVSASCLPGGPGPQNSGQGHADNGSVKWAGPTAGAALHWRMRRRILSGGSSRKMWRARLV